MLDKEEFQAWKDSPATQWVMVRLRQQATDSAQRVADRLLQLVSQSPDEIVAAQPELAATKGFSEALITVSDLRYESLLTDDEEAAMKEAEDTTKQ